MNEEHTESEASTVTPNFRINSFYLKSIDFDSEVPMHLVKAEWNPDARMDLDLNHNAYSNNHYSVELKIMINVEVEKKTIFTMKVMYGGIFEIAHYSKEDTYHLLNSHCASFIFPHACQMVSQVTTQAGYPTLNLAPIDFEARFQTLQEKSKRPEKEGA